MKNNIRLLRQFTFVIFAILFTANVNAGSCTLINLPINPISPEPSDIYTGQSSVVEVQFHNDKVTGTVDVFPEPPLTINNRKFNTSCAIDGGVWARNAVYISNDDSVVVMHEFSGSNDSLNFYSTQSCKKLNEIDISNSTWNIKESEISIAKQGVSNSKKQATKPTIYQLDASCKPVKSTTKPINRKK